MVLPNGATVNPQCESVKATGLVEVPDVLEKETCFNSETNLLNQNYQMMDRVDSSELCNLDVDIEKGMAETPKSSEDSIGCLKSDDSLAVCISLYIISLIKVFFSSLTFVLHTFSDAGI